MNTFVLVLKDHDLDLVLEYLKIHKRVGLILINEKHE